MVRWARIALLPFWNRYSLLKFIAALYQNWAW